MWLPSFIEKQFMNYRVEEGRIIMVACQNKQTRSLVSAPSLVRRFNAKMVLRPVVYPRA